MPDPADRDEREGEAGPGQLRDRLHAALKESSTPSRTAADRRRSSEEIQTPRQRLEAARLPGVPPGLTAGVEGRQSLSAATRQVAEPRATGEGTPRAPRPRVDGERIAPGLPSPARPRERGDRQARRRRSRTLMVAAPLALAVVLLGALTVGDDPPRGPSPLPEQPGVAAAAQGLPFAPPVALAPGESFVRTRVLADGTLRMSHWVVTERPVTTLSLSEPEALTTAGEVTAVDVRVVAGGAVVPGPAALTERTVDFRFDPSNSLRIDYVLEGVTERSGSVSGRALTHAAGLVVGVDSAPVRVTRSIEGMEVLSVACGSAPAAMTPCGRAEDGVWYVELDGRAPQPDILLQVNLPPA